MDTNKIDILQELSLEEIQNLLKIYYNHKRELPYIYSFLQVCINALETNMQKFVRVYSSQGCWQQDGTFIANVALYRSEIVLHSLDPSGRNLVKIFLQSNVLRDYIKNFKTPLIVLYAYHEQFHEKLLPIIRDVYGCKKIEILPTNVWCLEADIGLKLNTLCPDNVVVRELEAKDLKFIVQHWPCAYDNADVELQDRIKLCKGFGVYLKSNGQLLSWVTPSCLGHMATLHTLDGHKNKGYATMVVRSMRRYLSERGFGCCANVLLGNTASERFFTKLGFQILHKSFFLKIRK